MVWVFVHAVKSGYPDGNATTLITILGETHEDHFCPDGSHPLADGSCPSRPTPPPNWVPLAAFAAVGSAIVVAIVALHARRRH